MSFVYSRYICKGVWDEESVTPQYDIILAHADGSDNRVLVPGMVASEMVLSPDQQTLAFITSDPGNLHFGEVALWVINLDGTGLRKVLDLPPDAADLHWYTASMGSTTTPEPVTPLPTSGEIAYIQDGNIYLLNLANGQSTPLVTDGTVGTPDDWRGGIQLTWSPDGRRLAYASNRTGNYDIYALDVASGNTEQISSDLLDEYLPSFAPDGSLFFVRITQAHEHNNIVGEWVLIRSISPTQQTVVEEDGFVVDKIQVLSDDEILTITSGDMGWGSLSTGKQHVAWNNDNYCAWPGGGQSTFDAAWSRDGTTLAVIAADCPPGDTSGDWSTATLLVDAANPNAEPRRLVGGENLGSSLDWSPDKAWLVYGGRELWLVSASGGTPQRISAVGENPAWRPAATSGSVAPTATPQPIAPTISGDAAVSYIFTGHVTDTNGKPAANVLLFGDTCGSTTTNANGEYVLTWYATQPEPCTVRLYEQNVSAEGLGAVFDPPVYTFTTQGIEEKNFTMRTERRPLIFVPGIMGSKLYSNGSELWPRVLSKQFKKYLSLNPEDPFSNNKVEAKDIIRDVLWEIGINDPFRFVIIYDDIIKYLKLKGEYKENRIGTSIFFRCEMASSQTSLHVFAYDWRKSNAENAKILRDYIQCVQKTTGSQYVDIVAHSMGGILTRRYVLDNPDSHYIDRFISIATPWLGAPSAIAIMETGYYEGITPGIIEADELKNLVEFFPGPHELLPSPTYFQRAGSIFGEYGWDYNQNGSNNENYSFEGFSKAFDKHFASNPVETNKDFHTPLQDNLTEWYGVDHYNFYGNVDTDKTVTHISTTNIPYCTGLGGWFASQNREDVVITCLHNDNALFLVLSSGDGTVPTISAVPPPLKAPEECNNTNLHVACFYGNKDQADHNALVRNDGVITDLITILSRRNPPPSVAMGNTDTAYSISFRALEQQSSTTTAKPAHYITILNTPSATLTDQLGNTTDAISGTLSLPVPNASYYVLGEQAHMFVAPADQEYTLVLPVSSEPMYLELRTGTGNTTSSTVRYSDLNFPLTTTAALTISPQGAAELRYDSDGDGTFDTLVPPTVSVVGDASNDLDAPTVKIDVTRQGLRWMATITAEDAGSGVKQILYSTDDQHYQFYTEPFEVNPADGTTFYVFADDNVANRSGVVTYTLTPRGLWDLPGYVGLALLSLVLVGGVVLVRRSMARPPLTAWAFLGALLFLLALLILALFLIIPPLLGSISRSAPSVAPTSAARSNPEAITSVVPSPVPTLSAPTADAAVLVASPTDVPTSTPSEARIAFVPEPPIISRSSWGAMDPSTGLVPHTPARIVLSHEARSCCDDSLAARVRSNQSVHMNNGWPDIAYHYTIAPDGSIFAGRDVGFESNSSYTSVNPTYQLNGSIIIGILGNYDSQEPTPESLRSIRWLMAWLCQRYNISPDDLYPLSQIAPNNPFGEHPTTSPGGNMPSFTLFRNDVRAILAGEMAP
ncbi:lipase/acyltransferase domain-containing protein [Candidatus Oscillochloris fontis]|uniref:lipase/acyltransferase domain-containing protein n=1 Tax=Candidatus Oscillochloris fontis TaxID=2496868 RepID=UPI001375C373|nr:N-acetylmuramoyl-L-alanine amidase [Candidatus Oscillochloris fontis]